MAYYIQDTVNSPNRRYMDIGEVSCGVQALLFNILSLVTPQLISYICVMRFLGMKQFTLISPGSSFIKLFSTFFSFLFFDVNVYVIQTVIEQTIVHSNRLMLLYMLAYVTCYPNSYFLYTYIQWKGCNDLQGCPTQRYTNPKQQRKCSCVPHASLGCTLLYSFPYSYYQKGPRLVGSQINPWDFNEALKARKLNPYIQIVHMNKK